jgi:hypothetical protein
LDSSGFHHGQGNNGQFCSISIGFGSNGLPIPIQVHLTSFWRAISRYESIATLRLLSNNKWKDEKNIAPNYQWKPSSHDTQR